jgi:hypothetical protein
MRVRLILSDTDPDQIMEQDPNVRGILIMKKIHRNTMKFLNILVILVTQRRYVKRRLVTTM